MTTPRASVLLRQVSVVVVLITERTVFGIGGGSQTLQRIVAKRSPLDVLIDIHEVVRARRTHSWSNSSDQLGLRKPELIFPGHR